jgi:hypothetical protein
MAMRDTATTLGIVAIVVAVGSLFLCLPIAPLVAIAAAVLAVLAIRGGAKGLGITSLVIAALTLFISAAMMHQASVKLQQVGRELQQLSEKCWACDGKGVVDCPLCVNGRLPNGAICPACNGRGTTVCTICNGTGKAR